MEFILGILPFLTGVISAAFEKIQVSCDPCILSACVLSVAILYSRSGNAFLLSVQYFFHEYGPSILHFPIIHLNMALTSPKDRNFQLEQIDKWRTLREKFCENQQLELKLLDQRDILDERRNPAGSLSPVEEAEYQSIKIQLSGIRPRLWENAQGFSRLRKEWVLGCWTLDFPLSLMKKYGKSIRGTVGEILAAVEGRVAVVQDLEKAEMAVVYY